MRCGKILLLESLLELAPNPAPQSSREDEDAGSRTNESHATNNPLDIVRFASRLVSMIGLFVSSTFSVVEHVVSGKRYAASSNG